MTNISSTTTRETNIELIISKDAATQTGFIDRDECPISDFGDTPMPSPTFSYMEENLRKSIERGDLNPTVTEIFIYKRL